MFIESPRAHAAIRSIGQETDTTMHSRDNDHVKTLMRSARGSQVKKREAILYSTAEWFQRNVILPMIPATARLSLSVLFA